MELLAASMAVQMRLRFNASELDFMAGVTSPSVMKPSSDVLLEMFVPTAETW